MSLLTAAPRRPVELTITEERGVARGRRAAGGAVVAVVPTGSPWLGDVLPGNVVRATRSRTGEVGIEHLRFTAATPLAHLPNLSSKWPSKVADAVGTMLRVGATSVDVLLFRGEDLGPGELVRAPVRDQVLAYLPELWGAVLCTPDLALLHPRTTVEFHRSIAPLARDLFLVSCVDVPTGTDPGLLAESLLGADAAVCAWDGTPEALAAHGWRSAAALVAGLLSADLADPGRSLLRRRLPLLPPRRATVDRRPALTPRVRRDVEAAPSSDLVLRVEVDDVENVALVRTEPALRRPAGGWPLPALYCAKLVRRQVYEAADHFVFRPVTETEAIALGGAVSLALTPLAQRGLLVGPNGRGAPTIETMVVRDPRAPGLGVSIAGYLRPWMLQVSLQVQVQNGARADVQEL